MPAGEMDVVYSIGVNNRFFGININDDDADVDPVELIRAAQEKPKKEKEAKAPGKKEAKATKPAKEKVVKASSPVEEPVHEGKASADRGERPERGRGRGRGRGAPGGERGRGGDRGRGGERSRGRGGGRGRGGRGGFSVSGDENQDPNAEQISDSRRIEAEPHDDERPQSKFAGNSGGFGRGFSGGFADSNEGGEDRRGGRGGFGRGRGRGGFRGRGREFDRRSGSDRSSVKPVDKKEGSGSYNWGTPQDDLAASEEPIEAVAAPVEESQAPAPAITEEGAPETVEELKEAVEAEPKEMTLDEWKQLQQRDKPAFNIRKPNEGEKLPKGFKPLKKDAEEGADDDGALFFPRHIYQEKVKTSGRVKELVEVDLHFASGDNRHMDNERGRRGGRGNRGSRGGRGRGGRGRGRDDGEQGFGFGAPTSDGPSINLENPEEFPTLG